jgi:hypothetical protein
MMSGPVSERGKRWGLFEWAALATILALILTALTYFGISLVNDPVPPSTTPFAPPTLPPTTVHSTETTRKRLISGLTPSQYIARANSICAGASARVGELGDISPDDPLAEQKRIQDLREINVIYRRMEADLRSLRSPSGDEAELDQLYSLLDEALNAFREWVEIGAPEPSSSVEGERAALGLQRFQQAAQAYGLARCANLGP